MLYETEDERLAYRALVRDVLVLLQADAEVADHDSMEILTFETELANVNLKTSNSNILIYRSLFPKINDTIFPNSTPNGLLEKCEDSSEISTGLSFSTR